MNASRQILLATIAIVNSVANTLDVLAELQKGKAYQMLIREASADLRRARLKIAKAADEWKEGGD